MTDKSDTSELMKTLGFDGSLTIAVSVSDLDKAIQWYKKTLGLELIYKLDDLAWAEMTSPVANVTVGLGVTETPNVRGNTPVWGCQDLDATRKKMEQLGVHFDGETLVLPGMVKLADFKDPDGNPWKLSQTLA